MLRLAVDSQSTYPIHAQIKEQVKLALAFGELRAGDTLPSIRDLASELGIGPGVVRRAYTELARSGILSVSRSRRAVVNSDLQYKRESEALKKQTRTLAERVSKEILSLGIHPQSFTQFFQHWLVETRICEPLIVFSECNRLQAEQYAGEASLAWAVPVQGMDFDRLRRLTRRDLSATRHLLTIPYHYDEAREISRRAGMNLVTVSVNWDPEVLERMRTLGVGKRVAFVFLRSDHEQYGRLVVRDVEAKCAGAGLIFGSVNFEDAAPVEKWVLEQNDWDLIYFSNRIWESLPERVRACPQVSTPRLKTDPVSLEKARLEVGILS